jgi:hypothetical protein
VCIRRSGGVSIEQTDLLRHVPSGLEFRFSSILADIWKQARLLEITWRYPAWETLKDGKAYWEKLGVMSIEYNA